ncbi:hypothetical protein AXK11_02100 [Cephaloticoccus primus]|uniref:DUF4401 domain-containing protein n=1 Tax=Cephaloticoccus primus TaxID=1548207 RepID=A0A139SSQ8_9BACT|nr:GDYXXLXY domain-containing protein [Cephaloticoccus primus]KXU37609.1 hypothetical protein AXK11_02100 [Cephaloticoccus primus]
MAPENGSPPHDSSPQRGTTLPQHDSSAPLPSPSPTPEANGASDTVSAGAVAAATPVNPQDGTARAADAAERRRWFLLGNRLLAFLGVGLAAAGVVFFFAYNWAELHHFAKFGIAFAVLCASAGYALFSPNAHPGSLSAAAPRPPSIGWRAALFGTALLLGAVLALIGQVYQTGANLWELFAIWAVLIMPFALLARGPETWVLWLAVANTGLFLWLDDPWFFGSGREHTATQFLCAIVLNGGFLVLAERFAHSPLFTPCRELPRLAALLTLGLLGFAACLGVWEAPYYGRFIAPFIAAAVLSLALYRHYRFDLVMLGLSGFSLIGFLTTALFRLTWDLKLGLDGGMLYFGPIFNGAFLIGASAFFGHWLLTLHRARQHPAKPKPTAAAETAAPALALAPAAALAPTSSTHSEAADRADGEGTPERTHAGAGETPASPPPLTPVPETAGTPMWLNIVQGIAAWLAAAMITAPFSVVSFISPALMTVSGAGFIALAFLLFFKKRDTLFFTQAALALSITGQIFFAISQAQGDITSDTVLKLSLALALFLTIPRTTLLHRTICLFWAFFALLQVIEPSYEIHLLIGLPVSVAACALWLTRPRWTTHKHSEYFHALAHSSSLYVLIFLWTRSNYRSFYLFTRSFIKTGEPSQLSALHSTGAAILLIVVVAYLTRKFLKGDDSRDQRLSIALLVAAGLLALLAYHDASLVLCTALLLVTFATHQASWFRAMLVALPIVVGQMYYNLEQTLLARSLTLMGSGALLLALRWGLNWLLAPDSQPHAANTQKVEHSPNQAPVFAPFAALPAHARQIKLAALSPALALAVLLCLSGIWGNERTIAQGQPVFVRLAPVDPRSLMQGDFMALRFALDNEVLKKLPPRNARLRKDPRPTMLRPRYAYLALDDEGRATALHSIGARADALPDGTRVAIKLRGTTGSPSIGPNAFFFQEGHAAHYEQARWAELRVARSGKALLLNLRDENLEVLGETRR